MPEPQWLWIRRSEVKAEEAALARIQQHLDELRTRLTLLDYQLDQVAARPPHVIGTELLAEGRYRDRLRQEWESVKTRLGQAEQALRHQQERLARAKRALEVAEDVVREETQRVVQLGQKRQDQLVSDLAAVRRIR
jgi:predicted  nucleic acid-binding Zn-ribbon protein